MCIKKPSSGGLTESVSTRKKDETVFKEEFEELWKLYPRRQGHSEALKAYMDARHSGVTKEAVLRGVKAYARWIEVCRTDPRYVRQGGKWFQSRDWEDAESLEKAAAGGMLPRLGETNNPAAIRSKDHFYTRENLRKLGITFGDEDDDDDEDTG